MLISMNTLPLNKFGNIKEIIKLIHDAGFDAFDFTMYATSIMDCFVDKSDYVKRAEDLKLYADSIGIVCNQTHAFFPTIRPNDETWNKMGMSYTSRSLEIAGILGAKYCVVHPVNQFSAEKNEKNV